MLSVFISAVLSILAGEITRRALQNHRYATRLSRLTRVVNNVENEPLQFLVTSMIMNISASVIHVSGTVILGASLAARWRDETAWRDRALLVSEAQLTDWHLLLISYCSYVLLRKVFATYLLGL